MVEVISSLREDGSHVGYDIRQGIWVCVEADTDYIKNFQREECRYCSMYKRFHLIGLELGMSVAHVGARRETTGTPTHFIGDVLLCRKAGSGPAPSLTVKAAPRLCGLRPAAQSTAGRICRSACHMAPY